jgi:formylglycine-generating enzyme required for sulfatase activity
LVEIGRPYLISTTEIPIELYRQFDQEYAYPVFDKGYSSEAISGLHPATGLDWYMAANFCNWLTLQQGMLAADCCFVIDADAAETSSQSGSPSGSGTVSTSPPTIRLVENWRDRKGFRMPTEAEWEYSCQTEMPTVWSCGWSGEPTILGAYAWYRDSINDEYSTRRVASLKPNSIGLFDMHGNANEITLEQQSNAFPDDVNGAYFAVKGGAYFSPNFNLTPSAIRRSPLHAPNYGFRIVQSE